VLPLLQKYGEVVVLKAVNNPDVPLGHQAKLARSFLATTFPDDVVTVGDLDHYLFQPEWVKEVRMLFSFLARILHLSPVPFEFHAFAPLEALPCV
jgi:hypothetical protein